MTENLAAATRGDILQSIEFAVQFNSAGKATNAGREYAAAALADRVLQYLEQCGYVIMKPPPTKGLRPRE
jgi:hypothetical protein